MVQRRIHRDIMASTQFRSRSTGHGTNQYNDRRCPNDRHFRTGFVFATVSVQEQTTFPIDWHRVDGAQHLFVRDECEHNVFPIVESERSIHTQKHVEKSFGTHFAVNGQRNKEIEMFVVQYGDGIGEKTSFGDKERDRNATTISQIEEQRRSPDQNEWPQYRIHGM